MDACTNDDARDFVARQYASLVAGGMDDAAARARLHEVLGQAATTSLADAGEAGAPRPEDGTAAAARVLASAQRLGGNPAATQAALIQSHAEARLFALDWWRPIRTFLLYILFLLGLGVTIAGIYAAWVLPAFSQLDQSLAVGSGAAGWILSQGALRLFAPLLVMALVLALLTLRWHRMRLRMARLDALAGASRWPWLYGSAGSAWHALACLEAAAALQAGGVADAAILDAALQARDWPENQPFAVRDWQPGECLRQAERLGTFAAELEWQRRLAWSTAQSQLEISRDRLILFARVAFYILIGIMVTVLYLPIFTVASLFGVH